MNVYALKDEQLFYECKFKMLNDAEEEHLIHDHMGNIVEKETFFLFF